MEQTEYQRGWQEALNKINQTHISLEQAINTYDKFLDKINHQKKLLVKVYNHHEESIDFFNLPLNTIANKRKNLRLIIKQIKIELETSIEKNKKVITKK